MAKRTGNTSFALNSARSAKNDEFYTQLQDIENELCRYASQLKGKAVFCNCDDPAESNFFLYFVLNFKKFELKRIITTHYVSTGQSYKIEVGNANMAKKIAETIQQGYDFNSEVNRVALKALDVLTPLQENGDFRSPECIELLKRSDAVITNPPFSLWREYVAQLIEYRKLFLIIGNVNAITYKEIFPLIKENKMWLGESISSGDRKFGVPDDYPLNATGCGIDKNGYRFIRVKGVRWFTNVSTKTSKRHEELRLYKTYNATAYPKYDNYDAIEVSKVAEIPVDYNGVMGVPITFLDKYNPQQFELIGSNRGVDQDPNGVYGRGSFLDGKETFKRLFICRKQT